MGDLTIDQILNEYEGSVKEASVSTSFSGLVSDEEVEKMATLLKEASVPNFDGEEDVAEKIAEARILTATCDFLQEEGTKLASFREDALSRGFSSAEVDDFIEKKAKAGVLQRLLSSPITKATAAAGLTAGAGALGFKKGKDKGEAKTTEVAQAAFKAGRIVQNAQDRQVMQKLFGQRG